MTKKIELPVERLQELLAYDPTTGEIFWKASKKPAGHQRKDGYLQIRVDGKLVYGHRAAFAIATGAWPLHMLDHKDGNPRNNKLENLRDVPSLINQQNMQKAQKHSQSKLLGVSPHQGKWRATIYVNKKQKFLGYFATAEEGYAAYIEAKRKLHDGCML